MEKKQTKTSVQQRSDGMWIVDAKLSAVRIGLQDKEFVKRGHNTDYSCLLYTSPSPRDRG